MADLADWTDRQTVPRCVVFDIDDTLYLERDYVRSGFETVGAWARDDLGLSDFASVAWRAFEEGTRRTVFDEALREWGVEPTHELVTHLVGIYRRHEPAIEMLPDALAALQLLDGRVELAVVTDGPAKSQRAKARGLGLERWARLLVFTEELGEGFGKPHPAAFQLVQDQFGWSKTDCVYVADNPGKDFEGPKSLGWRTIRVRRAASLWHQAESGPLVDHELTDLWTLPGCLGMRTASPERGTGGGTR